MLLFFISLFKSFPCLGEDAIASDSSREHHARYDPAQQLHDGIERASGTNNVLRQWLAENIHLMKMAINSDSLTTHPMTGINLLTCLSNVGNCSSNVIWHGPLGDLIVPLTSHTRSCAGVVEMLN